MTRLSRVKLQDATPDHIAELSWTWHCRERGKVKGGMEGNRRVTKAGCGFVCPTMSALPENVIDSRQSPPLR